MLPWVFARHRRQLRRATHLASDGVEHARRHAAHRPLRHYVTAGARYGRYGHGNDGGVYGQLPYGAGGQRGQVDDLGVVEDGKEARDTGQGMQNSCLVSH